VIFRAIADPTRREILNLLREGSARGRRDRQQLPHEPPAISKHLRLLESAGLVVAQRRGTARICELNARPLRMVNDWLRDYQVFWKETLHNLKRYVEEEDR